MVEIIIKTTKIHKIFMNRCKGPKWLFKINKAKYNYWILKSLVLANPKTNSKSSKTQFPSHLDKIHFKIPLFLNKALTPPIPKCKIKEISNNNKQDNHRFPNNTSSPLKNNSIKCWKVTKAQTLNPKIASNLNNFLLIRNQM